jgi:hypothetical protein
MLQDMFDSPVECTGLMHLETRIEEHKKLQENLSKQFAYERFVVLTHNGGRDYQTLKSKRTSSQSRGYVVESKFPLTALGEA